MRGSFLEFSECGSRIAESKNLTRFQIRKSEINNPRYLKTPRRGQSAESPDRFIVKKRLISRRFCFGITPAPQYSLNLTTKSPSVKPPQQSPKSQVQCPKSAG